jgi:hypothetical protein
MNTAGSNKLAQAASDGATRPSIPLVLPSLLLWSVRHWFNQRVSTVYCINPQASFML